MSRAGLARVGRVVLSGVGRLFRLAFGAAAILGSAACVLVGWLWWHSRHVYQDRAEIIARARYVQFVSSRDGVNLSVVRRWGWPGPGEARLASIYTPEQVETHVFNSVGERNLFAVTGSMSARSGRWQTYMSRETPDAPPPDETVEDNRPVRVNRADTPEDTDLLANGWRWSVALPVVDVKGVPHWLIFLATASPVVPYLLIRVCDLILWRRRRRRRLATQRRDSA